MSNIPTPFGHGHSHATPSVGGHSHAHSPSMWNKTPFGFGESAMVPFVNPMTGTDMSRNFVDPVAYMNDMQRHMMHDMNRAIAHPSDFDRTVRHMEHAMQREMMSAEREMQRMLQNIDRSSQFSSELVHHPARPASIMEHYSLMNPIRIDAEGNRWLNCCFDLRSFKPEEINVTLNSKERCINVEANHEVKDSKDHYIKRHYARKFYLPENMNADLAKLELKSCLTNEGLLCIESALPKISAEEAAKMAVSTPATMSTVPITVKHI